MMNVDHGDLGFRLHQLIVQFNLMYPVEFSIQLIYNIICTRTQFKERIQKTNLIEDETNFLVSILFFSLFLNLSKIHQLNVFQKILLADPIFEDLILNEMPDVGFIAFKSISTTNLPEEEQDDDLDEKAEDDLINSMRLFLSKLSLQRIFFFEEIGIFFLCE